MTLNPSSRYAPLLRDCAHSEHTAVGLHRRFICSLDCLQAPSSDALVLGFLARSDHIFLVWSNCPWKVARCAAGTLLAMHAWYFVRKSSQAATPVVWALSPVLNAWTRARRRQRLRHETFDSSFCE